MKSYISFIRSEPRFLAFGFVLTFFSSFGQTFFISIFGDDLQSVFELSKTQYGLTYSIATLCSGLTIIYVGKKIDTIDLRTFTLLLCAGLAGACVLMGAAFNVIMLAVAFFLLRLCGQGLLSHTAMTSMSRYFDRQRGKAMSIASLGFPAGEAILPLAVVGAIATIGWRQTWFGVALAVVVVLIPAVLFLLRGHGARHEAHVAATKTHTDDVSSKAATVGYQWTQRQVLGDIRFYLYLPAVIAPGFIITGVFFHQDHLIDTKAWTKTWFAACFIAFASAQVMTSIAAGPLVDRFGATRLMALFLLPLASSMIVIATGFSPLSAALFLAMFGITAGLGGTTVGAMWAEVYGTLHLGAIRAMATAIMVFGTAASPVLFGALIDRGISMGSIAWMCCAYTCVAIVLTHISTRLHGRSKKNISQPSRR